MSNEKRSQIVTGTVLICAGIIFLLNTTGYFNWNIWVFFHDFWPLIIIMVGFNILLQNTKVWWLVPILIIILFGMVIYLGINYPGFDLRYHNWYPR